MTDEFVQYTYGGVHASTEGNMLRMWGEFGEYGEDQVHPTGISFHWPDSWDEFTPGESEAPRVSKLESLAKIAERAEIPLIWFGEHKISWRSGTGSVEIGTLHRSDDGTFDTELELVEISDLEPKIQDLLNTDLSIDGGVYKPENKTTNSFQDYTRQYLPRAYIIQDFDIFVEESPGEPAALVEIKRTRARSNNWTPYSNDWPNYYLQLNLASESDIKPLLIHHEKQLIDGEQVGFYYNLSRPQTPDTDEDTEFLEWEREIMSASEARQRLRTCDFDLD